MDFEVCTWLCALTLAPLVTSSLTTSVCPASEAMCSAVFPFWIRIDRETTARANEWHILINPSTTCLCHPIQRGVLSHWHPTAIPYPLPERCCFRWPVIYLQTHTSFLQSECSTRGFLYPVWTCSQEQRTPCDIKHRHKHLLKLCVCVCVSNWPWLLHLRWRPVWAARPPPPHAPLWMPDAMHSTHSETHNTSFASEQDGYGYQ